MEYNRQIILNRAKCLSCGDVITSFNRHDYVTCSCGKLSVDGGQDYLRRAYNDALFVEEMCVYDDDPYEIIRENFYRGSYGKNGDEPLKYVKLSEMSDDWLKNVLIYEEDKGNYHKWFTKLYVKEMDYRKKNNILII